MNNFSICLPVYNEAEGIIDWITEIQSEFSQDFDLVIVNDASTDKTLDNLRLVQSKFNNVIILENDKNKGHGRSLRRAIDYSLLSGYQGFMTVDGDGQYYARDLKRFYDQCIFFQTGYSEGVRISRHDPMYRKVISLLTRVIVFVFTGKMPRDANTPVRYYSQEIARDLWIQVDSRSIIPNLMVSIISRKSSIPILTSELENRDRRADNKLGSTWQHEAFRFKYLPPRSFLIFCRNALGELLRSIK
jgi:glycosyltransferase involved in cell wall biosynthesis